MSPAIRIGICGCGRLAEHGYLPALRELRDVRVDALADPDPERLDTLARSLERGHSAPRLYAGAEEMLAGGRLDGLIVATPPDRHVADARAAAAAGITALVEKPPARDLAGALALAGLDPVPLVAFNRRFSVLGALRDSLGSERPDGLELDLELAYRRRSWRAIDVRDDALLDIGPHLIDLAGWTTGLAVSAVRATRMEQERAEVELRLGGERALARLSLATDSRHRERAVAVRDGRRVAVARTPGALRGLIGRVAGAPHPLVSSLRDITLAYAGVLRGAERGRLASVAEAARTMAVIDAARSSAESGGSWTDVERVTAPEGSTRRRRRRAA
ncbi:Gfo/Idh/MocA family oxidoreductase [Thermoleophilia bacterium SCSIO 60948]|nr:Gfo/Idh/MocA family oxidoreductase [Thermoleophilia bacterium SCSIO 60948]